MGNLSELFGGHPFDAAAWSAGGLPWRQQAHPSVQVPANDPELPDQWRIPRDAGWSVFPLPRGSKSPAISWKRFESEHADERELWRWSASHSNTAIVTGQLSGIVVLDLDSEESSSKAEALGLPVTVEARTPRGRHVYFRHPGRPVQNRTGVPFQGADIRGDGGFVVAPDSEFQPTEKELKEGKLPGGYLWERSPADTALAQCPDWLLERLFRNQERPLAASSGGASTDYVSAAVTEEVQCVRLASEGSRNETLNKAAFNLGQLHDQLDETIARDELMKAGIEAGLSPEEVRSTVKSGWNAGRAAPRSAHSEQANSEPMFRQLRLSVLENTRAEPPPFPLDVLGEAWGKWVVGQAAAASAPVDYVAVPLLVCAGALLGNSRRISVWPGWEEPSILWGCIVGEPSAGKTPALRPVLDLLKPIDRHFRAQHEAAIIRHKEAELKADAAKQRWKKENSNPGRKLTPPPPEAIAPPAPGCPALKIDDVTPERLGSMAEASPRGLLLVRDEIAGWLGDMDRYSGGGERPMWLQAWNGDERRIDRQGRALPIIVPRFSVGILGGIQPDKFDAAFGSSVDDGLIPRFLYTWPNPVARQKPEGLLPWHRELASKAASRLFHVPFALDEDGELAPRVHRLSPAAESIFVSWWQELAGDKCEGLAKSAWGKMQGQALRLALVLQFLWWSSKEDLPEPDQISEEAIVGAMKLIDMYFKPMALRVFGEAAIPLDISAASKLARFIAATQIERFNARELQRGTDRLKGRPSALKDHATLMKACEALVDAGWLREERSRDSDIKGRERRDYAVNPELWSKLQQTR